jgi:hypothetical protein
MGNPPDVRVRLSAEGEQAVVNAFKKIQAEADKTGRVGSRGLNSLTASVSNLARFLPSLTFAGAIAGATILAKRSLEAGDNFAKLSQRSGVSVETLSAYAHGAELSGIETDDLAKALARLSKNMLAGAKGSEQQINAFKQVGITQKELQSGSITLDQALERIAGTVASLPDGWQKSALAQELFGKSGAQLIPLLNQGRAGLAEMRAEAERLGLVFDTKTALAAETFNDNLKRLQGTVQGLVNREMAAALPLLVEISDALLRDADSAEVGTSHLAKLTSGLLQFGAAARYIVKSSTALTLAGPLGLIPALGKWRLEFEGELAAIAELMQRAKTKSAATGKPAAGKGDLPFIVDETARSKGLHAAKTLADAQLAFTRSALDNELALAKAHNSVMAAEDERSFKEGLLSVKAYYQARREALQDEGANEVFLLERQVTEIEARLAEAQKRPLAKGEPGAAREAEVAKIQKDLAKAQADAELRRIQLKGESAKIDDDERQAVRQFDQERLKAEADVFAAQGNRFAAERAELEAQLAALQRLKGETVEEFATRRAALQSAGETRIQFAELQAQAQLIFGDIDSSRTRIEAAVTRGLISQTDGERELAALEQQRLPALIQIAAAMRAAAITPEQIQAAQEFSDRLTQLAASADITGQRLAQLRADIEGGLTQAFTSFFTTGITEAESFGDAMRSLAGSVVSSIQQIIAQMLAMIVVQAMLKSLGSVFPGLGLAGGGLVSGGGAETFAGGGLVRGPGSSTSDSIPARLSDEEFVVKAAAVRRPGVLALLESLNNFDTLRIRPLGGVRRFASGGLVEASPASASARSGANLSIGLDRGLLLQDMAATSDWDRVIVKTLEGNRRAVRQLLR